MSASKPNRFWRLLSSVGPAFFLVGYTIGTGSIVTMASAGSRYGMSLLWVLFLACVFAWVLLEAYGNFAMVTGYGALHGYRKYIRGGNALAIFMLIGLILVEIMALAGNMGILSDLISKWSGMLFGGREWNPLWVVAGIIIVVYSMVLYGEFSYFEKLMIVFVSMMGLSFLITMFIVLPDPKEIAIGFMFSIPEQANTAMIISAIVGTTLTAPTYVVRSILMKEKKWDATQIKHGGKDSILAAVMMFVLSGSIMVCATGTLYVINKPVDEVITMVALLEPLLGRFAISILILGIVGAALSSLIPIMMLAPLLISDYRNQPMNYKSPMFRIFCGIAILFGLFVPVFNARPVFAMLVSQAFQVFILPICVVAIMYLVNRKDLMGVHKAKIWMNIGLILAAIFTVIMTWQAVVGLKESINTMF